MQSRCEGTVSEEDADQEDREGYGVKRVVTTVFVRRGAKPAWLEVE